jgi:S-DNA-T family DNA segregation ATPase FtsK/SpoIIIE
MAYQVRQRDPLLDSSVQITLARRGREGLGALLALVGLALGAMLWSYHPDDPSWLAATDAPPRNLLGMAGASLAAPTILILGYGAYGLAAGALAWGLRLALHAGSERALPRVFFVPAWVLVLSIYAASARPGAGWSHDFGLGGLFGDMAMGAMLSILPIPSAAGLKLLTFVIAGGAALMGAWVLGFTRDDLRRGAVFLLRGLGHALHLLRLATGLAARGALAGTTRSAAALAEARARRASAGDEVDAEPEIALESRRGLRALLTRRPAPSEDDAFLEDEPADDLPDDDRVRARIASAVRSRMRRATMAQATRPAPVAAAPSAQRAEPVLTAALRRADPASGSETAAADPRPEPTPEIASAPSIFAKFDPMDGTRAPLDMVGRPGSDGQEIAPEPAEPPAVPARSGARAAPPAPEPTSDGYEMPPLSLLADPSTIERLHLSEEALRDNARMLEAVLEDYGVKGEIVSVRPGPVVTMYELEPAPGLKASRVIGLADDIARSMSALSARVSTVPGRSVIGIELPNERRENVLLREILSSDDYADSTSELPLALGKDIGGAPVVANLAKMPHLLIAGTTGSGKSVAINTMILSLLYKLSPEDCRLIMIDPKMLELSVYDGIPHLLSPVVTDPKKAVVALKWAVGEMEERYRKMSKMGVRNIGGYNARVEETLARGEMFSRTIQTGFDDETGDPVFETEETVPEKLPFIVVVVDEMADLMMVAGKEIEACIQRLAQMARASGIHLVMATQRPSVDVITGTVKANFPTRISFHVTSKIDSRTILGEMGAEQLLGMGDMLYMAGGSKITRVHGPFCSDEEVEEIVNHLKSFGPPDYAASVLEGPAEDSASDIDAVLGLSGGNTGGEDALYDQAVAIVARDRKCSTSYIQRKLGIGYNKAARLVEQMEEEGAVTPANHVGKRDILLPDPSDG